MSIDLATGVNRIYGPTGYPNYHGSIVANEDGSGYIEIDIDFGNSETPLVTAGASGDIVAGSNFIAFPAGTAFGPTDVHVLATLTGVGSFVPSLTQISDGTVVPLATFALPVPVGYSQGGNQFDLPDEDVYVGYDATGLTAGVVRMRVKFQVPQANAAEVS